MINRKSKSNKKFSKRRNKSEKRNGRNIQKKLKEKVE